MKKIVVTEAQLSQVIEEAARKVINENKFSSITKKYEKELENIMYKEYMGTISYDEGLVQTEELFKKYYEILRKNNDCFSSIWGRLNNERPSKRAQIKAAADGSKIAHDFAKENGY